MLLGVGVLLLILALGYLWLDGRVRQEEAAQPVAPRASYACRHCGRPVDMASTVRPIRLTLLCPEHYHAQYGALRPAPGPKLRRRQRPYDGSRPFITILPRR